MKARVQRIYFEELEEIIENLQGKIDKIKLEDNLSDYEKDIIIALTHLSLDLDEFSGVTK